MPIELKLFIGGLVFLVLAIIMQATKKKFQNIWVALYRSVVIIGSILFFFFTNMLGLTIGFLVIGLIGIEFGKNKLRSNSPEERFKKLYSWVDTLWTALIIASILMFFFIQAFKIPSGSMESTLLVGDHLFVNKFVYGFHVPFTDGKRILPIKHISRGDIVVFQAPERALFPEEKAAGIKKDFIKRCVAIAGDKVEIKNKKLFVNDVEVNEPYTQFLDSFSLVADMNYSSADFQARWETGRFADNEAAVRDNFGPITVPAGCYMMMGDNRDRSFDSRYWCPVQDNLIKGKALFLYWPVNRWRIVK